MISLEQANRIIAAIFARAREQSCRPMSVIVVEPGAKIKAFQKEDDSAMMRFEMAFGKAYAALAREFLDRDAMSHREDATTDSAE